MKKSLLFVLLLTLLFSFSSYAFAATPMVAADYHHTVSLKADGTVWAWGNNDDGQLGYSTTSYYSPAATYSGPCK